MTIAIKPLQAQSVWDGTTYDYSWYDASETEFYIYTAEELAGLAALVNGTNGATVTTFQGKTVYLMADVWLNADGSITNNWPAIGGGGSKDTQASYWFSGRFDGGHHIIYNMFCDKTASTTGTCHAALFGCISALSSADTAIVRNVVMKNVIAKASSSAAAMVALAKGANPVLIENCLGINVNVRSNNGAGILSMGYNQNNHNLYIANCAVTGGDIGSTSESGGIEGNLGSSSYKAKIINCYF
ncbi:hypothetical protein LJC68_10545 [Bacteroidales bacterium OttesenSCG-928-B11]|nr:hypothetical protein [Bacteroidales bacterium OttesenSCG-928-C03]MDL2313300.1 hypothetical protein [Bacteroidales bacterium OttesenSCG-928-B11]MDL2326275.1 hypothetical protein [Bacteroidales bacterium OttesenSCG-928-A14]